MQERSRLLEQLGRLHENNQKLRHLLDTSTPPGQVSWVEDETDTKKNSSLSGVMSEEHLSLIQAEVEDGECRLLGRSHEIIVSYSSVKLCICSFIDAGLFSDSHHFISLSFSLTFSLSSSTLIPHR